MVTSRQMKTYGLEKSDYGQIAVAQRAWAAGNPYAVYRTPMTMDEYLAAPLVADPLSRYDCVPVVAGAQAIDRGASRPLPARPRAGAGARPPQSFNYDNQEGDGLRTGISTFADELWAERRRASRGCRRRRDLRRLPGHGAGAAQRSRSDPGNDLQRFARREIGERRFPLNTWGGLLSAGQPGGPAGGLNGISEAVLQLQHRAGGAPGAGRAAGGGDRLRHDHVPLWRHRRRAAVLERDAMNSRASVSGAASNAATAFFRSG